MLSAGAPVAADWIADRQSAPLILNYGSEAQREYYIPRICRGELVFCIGMSEPGSGSDLASVRTRAERTADGWRVNGQKIWTTNAMHGAAHAGNHASALREGGGRAGTRCRSPAAKQLRSYREPAPRPYHSGTSTPNSRARCRAMAWISLRIC